MNKLENFRFADMRKRNQYVLILVLTGVLSLALLLLLWLGIFNFRDELVTVRMSEELSDDTYYGAGINLDYIPNVNLIRNPSFETYTKYYTYQVSDVEGNSVFFEPEEIISGDIDAGHIEGSSIRLLSIDSDGIMTLKYDGVIQGFESARLGSINKIEDSLGLIGEDDVIKTEYLQSTIVALTSGGKLISDISSSQLSESYGGFVDNFVDITSNSTTCYGITENGKIYSSADGRNFSLVLDASEYINDNLILGCAANADTFITLLSDGKILILSGNKVTVTNAPSKDLKHIISTDTEFLFCGNEMYVSANGMVFDSLNVKDNISGRILSVDSCGNKFYVLTDELILVVDRDSNEVRTINNLSEMGVKATSMVVTTKGQIILLTEDSTAVMVSETSGNVEVISSENVVVNRIMHCPNNGLIYSSAGDIYTSEVLADFKLNESVPENTVFHGDFCVIGQENNISLSSSEDSWSSSDLWNVYGSGTSCQFVDDSADGSSALKLSGSGENIHVLSQYLKGSAIDNFNEDSFYRMSFKVKGDASNVSVWVEGDTLGKIGINASVNDEYKEYSYIFVVNKMMLADESVRFNVSFEGTGNIILDDIYLGLDSYDSSMMPNYFRKSVIEANPSVIRLNNIRFGSDGFSNSSIYGLSKTSYSSSKDGEYISDTVSLEDSLRLVKESGACPWFVFGTSISQKDINNLFAYLCGSVNSEYGTLRINNGTALPWSRQFENIYIEIKDTKDSFSGDVQRSAYVDYVISMIEQSEYYSDIKDKIVYLDGMTYDGGTMLSSADSHAMDMYLEKNDMSFIDNLNNTYETYQYNSPRVTSPSDLGEYISSFSSDYSLNCAEYMTIILSEEASFASRHMFNLDINFIPSKYDSEEMFVQKNSTLNMLRTLKLLGGYETITDLFVEARNPLSDTPIQTSEEFLKTCGCFMFKSDDKAYVVITNPSEYLQQFLISKGEYDYDKATNYRYSNEGNLLTSRPLGGTGIRHTLQPGEFIIIEIKKDK